MTPTARSLKYAREQGWLADVVERWIPGANIRRDLFGIVDIVCLVPGNKGVLGIQATSTQNMRARETKILTSDTAKPWLDAGNKLVVWGWAKKGTKGKRKLWTLSQLWIGPEL